MRREISAVAGSQLEVACFGSPGARISNFKANAENVRIIRKLGADKMIVGTDGPEQVSVEAPEPVARAVRNPAELTEDLGVDIAIEFDWSPMVRSLASAVGVAVAREISRKEGRVVRLAEITDEPSNPSWVDAATKLAIGAVSFRLPYKQSGGDLKWALILT